ncbi:hypothetical protein NG895_15560 [Aeoliella sp. ICT_H6.2]|uniref:Uncharacterized protein n=1 Tax=Aeoliella straminimaris TaxID=2954799 RepID=A0A9X2JI60_9BACT|nr:hypothetical protein [Aeoliella straminimaris]MCO6045328.1 hypothetical protein [Aeoliella straminimaris]
MSRRRSQVAKTQVRFVKRHNTACATRNAKRHHPQSRRTNVGHSTLREPFSPPENWYEPHGEGGDYKIVVQDPGAGYRHVVTPQQVRDRLAALPASFTKDLEVVQFSRITRKKQSFPCYGMQWGSTLYLYPLEETLVESFGSPPPPTFYNEAKMYGGEWRQEAADWTLHWTENSIRDFYLNNILIHELGHLLDERNSTYLDRERYAEWFATHYGYLATGGLDARRPNRKIRRRHHKS